MHRFLAASLVVLASSASAQSTWSNDQFTVTSDPFTDFTVSNGTVQITWLPFAISNGGTDSPFYDTPINLMFQAQPGYRLVGEQVSFGVRMTVDTYGGPIDFGVTPKASFQVTINGVYSMGNVDVGGTSNDAGAFFLRDPDMSAVVGVGASEGFACPAGHGDNGCNFDLDPILLEALTQVTSFDVTPLLVPVPEPATAGMYLAALGLFGLARARRARQPARAPSAHTMARPLDVHASKRAS